MYWVITVENITSFPVGICLANLTLAKLPLPMVLSSRYLPMCGSSEVRLREEGVRPPPPVLSPPCNTNGICQQNTKRSERDTECTQKLASSCYRQSCHNTGPHSHKTGHPLSHSPRLTSQINHSQTHTHARARTRADFACFRYIVWSACAKQRPEAAKPNRPHWQDAHR